MKKILSLALVLLISSLNAMQKEEKQVDVDESKAPTALDMQFIGPVRSGHIERALEYLRRGANPNTFLSSQRGNTALHFAVKTGSKALVRELLKRRADVFVLNQDVESVFDYAQDDEMRFILNEAARFENTEPATGTSISLSGQVRHPSRATPVLSYEPVPLLPLPGSMSTSESASPAGVGLILLIDIMPFIDVNCVLDGHTALHHFLERGEDVVRILLESVADCNAFDGEGNTVLMRAIRAKNESLVRLLLEHGANIQARNQQNGKTALMLAAESGHIPLLTLEERKKTRGLLADIEK